MRNTLPKTQKDKNILGFRNLFCLLLIYFSIGNGFAQIAPVVPSATTIANCAVAVIDDWSGFQNLPALAHIEKTELGIRYENRFMINELSTKSAQVGFNAKFINIGVSFSQQGYSVYNEMLAGLGFARNFDNKFSMGVQFDYYAAYFTAQDENRYRGALLAQFGVAATIIPKLTVGFHTFNPFQTNIQTEYTIKRIPSIFSIGTNYAFAENFRWLTQIDKEVSSNYRFASGFEYRMVKELTVKLGAYATDYLVPTIGFGVHLRGLHLHLNAELHPLLGLNSLAGINYRF